MALYQRYTIADERGAIVITGNALGLSGQSGSMYAGKDHAINQFITTDVTLPVPNEWSKIVNLNENANICFDWMKNSSAAFLNMLPGSTVLYAELIWCGLSVLDNGSGKKADVTEYINDSIELSDSTQTYSVVPDQTTAQSIEIPGKGTFYCRSSNVTNFIANEEKREYTVGKIPSAIDNETVSTISHAGWTLIVCYQNSSLPPRNMTVFAGAEFVTNGEPNDFNVKGFATPIAGPIHARVLISAQEGDACKKGTEMFLGPDVTNLTALSGPNNPIDNFFSSQINIGDPNNGNVGNVDITGTFGKRNSNAQKGTTLTAGRHGWDITNIEASQCFINDQNTAAIRLKTEDDDYVLNGLGIQIDTTRNTNSLYVDKTEAYLGETLTYLAKMSNEGGTAQKVIFKSTVPVDTEYDPVDLLVSTDFTGDLEAGIEVTIPSNTTIWIEWNVTIRPDRVPENNTIVNKGIIIRDNSIEEETNEVTTQLKVINLEIPQFSCSEPFTNGDWIEYRITIRNTGDCESPHAVLTMGLDPGIRNPEFRREEEDNWTAFTNDIEVGKVNTKEEIAFLVRGHLASDQTAPIISSVGVKDVEVTAVFSEQRRLDTEVVPKADMSVELFGPEDMRKGPADVNAVPLMEYSAIVKNNGPSAATGVELSISFEPYTLSFDAISYSMDDGANFIDIPRVSPWVIPIGTVNAGISKRILYRALTRKPVVSYGLLRSKITVSADTSDPELSNNESEAETRLESYTDMVLSMSAEADPIEGSTDVIYSIEVANRGPKIGHRIAVTDAMPTELQNPKYRLNESGEWKLWSGTTESIPDVQDYLRFLPINGIFNIQLKGTPTGPINNITNTASVTVNDQYPDLSDASRTVTGLSGTSLMAVTKHIDSGTVVAGQMLQFSITISNESDTKCVNKVVVNLSIPENVVRSLKYTLMGNYILEHNVQFGSPLYIGDIDADATKEIIFTGELLPWVTSDFDIDVITQSSNAPSISVTFPVKVSTSADISITQTSPSDSFMAGQEITIDFEVANNGPSDAQDVKFIGRMPTELVDLKASVNGEECQPFEPPYIVSLGTLRGGNFRVGEQPDGRLPVKVSLKGQLDPKTVNEINGNAEVTTTTYDPHLDNNSVTIAHTVSNHVYLIISKMDFGMRAVAGSPIIYAIEINNCSISEVTNLKFKPYLDQQIYNPEYYLNGQFIQLMGVDYTIERIPVGITRLFIVGEVTSYATGKLESNVEFLIPEVFIKLITFEDKIEDAIEEYANLEIKNTVLEDSITAGNPITYRIKINNLGPTMARNLSFTDLIPTNITNVKYSIDGGNSYQRWTSPYRIESLNANEEFEVLLHGIVEEGTISDIETTVYVHLDNLGIFHNNQTTATAHIETSADLAIKRSAVLQVNKYAEHSIAITNHGPSSARQIELLQELTENLKSPEYSSDGGFTWYPWTGKTDIAILPSGTMTTILMRGLMSSEAMKNAAVNRIRLTEYGNETEILNQILDNNAEILSDTPDPNLKNNTSLYLTVPDGSSEPETVNLTITETVNLQQQTIGSKPVYTITVTNQGTTNALDVQLLDLPPENLSMVHYSTNGGQNWNDWNGFYTIGTLLAGESITVLIQGTVTNSQLPYVLNVASFTTSSPNVGPTNKAVLVTPIVAPTNTVVLVTPIVAPSTKLKVFQSCDYAYAIAGQPLFILASICNYGEGTATNVLISKRSSQSYQNIYYSTDNGITWDLWDESYQIDEIEQGGYAAIWFLGMVGDQGESFIINEIQANTVNGNVQAESNTIQIPIVRYSEQ